MTHDMSKRMATDLAEGYDDVARGIARMTKHLGADASDAVSRSAAAFVHAASELAEQIKNESIELAKRFGGAEGHRYVNGILDRAAAQLRPDEVAAGLTAERKPRQNSYAVTHTRQPAGKTKAAP